MKLFEDKYYIIITSIRYKQSQFYFRTNVLEPLLFFAKTFLTFIKDILMKENF